jgi:hypothetical protein
MDVAAIEVLITPIDRTRAIHRPQCGALRAGRQPPRPTHIERHAVAAEDDGDDVRVTRMPPCGLGGDRGAVGVLTHRAVVTTGDEGLVVDQHRHLRRPHTERRRLVGDEPVEGVGHHLVTTQRCELIALRQHRNLRVERAADPVALLGRQGGEQTMHAGVVIDLHRHRHPRVLPGGTIEAVIVGDLIHQRTQSSPERLRRQRRCQFGDLTITPEQHSALGIIEPARHRRDRIGMLDTDLALPQRLVQPRCVAQHLPTTFSTLRGSPRRTPVSTQHIDRRSGLTNLMQHSDPPRQRGFELIGPAPDHRHIVQRRSNLTRRQHRNITSLPPPQTLPHQHHNTIPNTRSIHNPPTEFRLCGSDQSRASARRARRLTRTRSRS